MLQLALSLAPFLADGAAASAVIIVLALAYCAAAAAIATRTSYFIEKESLVMERDLISYARKVIPLRSIDNLHIKTSFFGKFLKISDVYVDTPGGEGFELAMHDIPDSLAVELASLVEGFKAGG